MQRTYYVKKQITKPMGNIQKKSGDRSQKEYLEWEAKRKAGDGRFKKNNWRLLTKKKAGDERFKNTIGDC